jgi:hypothetical protein
MARTGSSSLVVSLIAGLLLAACGGGQSSSQPNVASLRGGLVHNGELAGMNATTSSVVRGAANWTAQEQLPPSQSSAEIERLRRLGFVAGVSEQLTSGNQDRYGLTAAEQFRSVQGATGQVADETATAGPWVVFSVPGIPDARGFEQTGKGEGGRNIAFRHGAFVYLIGTGWQSPARDGVTRTALIAAAQQLYRRVSG